MYITCPGSVDFIPRPCPSNLKPLYSKMDDSSEEFDEDFPSNHEEDDAQLTTFMDITGADLDTAKQFLQIAGGEFQTAITLYVESGGGKNQDHTTTSTNTPFVFNDEPMAEMAEPRAPIAPRREVIAEPDYGGFEPTFAVRGRGHPFSAMRDPLPPIANPFAQSSSSDTANFTGNYN